MYAAIERGAQNRGYTPKLLKRGQMPCGRPTKTRKDCIMDYDLNCPDGLCKLRIQMVDNAIGHTKNEWGVILEPTREYEDVANALRFCEVFHLEAKVSISSDGYQVLVRSEYFRPRSH